MRATIQGRTLAEAPADETITIEGRTYFPPSSVAHELLDESDTPYVCPWKGRCQYFNAVVGNDILHDVAWTYPDPLPSAIAKVGTDFSDYVAFAPDIAVGSD
ncbi:DUF427 domain-containing protein [Streptomyces sp. NPDC093675]|uniref:DUF427 domain-containing protein n=1 Tax=Streptomyces sp. NPDC093675 TaxID=3366049 RepID=UPI00382454F4